MKTLVRSIIAFLLVLSMLVAPLSACTMNSGNGGKATKDDTTDESSPDTTTPQITTKPGDSVDGPGTTTPTVTEPDLDEPVPQGKGRIVIVNGTLENSVSVTDYEIGATFTATAKTPSNGYRFSHWEDSEGNRVGTSATISRTVTESETYKAYYEVCFGNNRGTAVMTDLETEWRQGGTDGKMTAWTDETDRTRISFKTPYRLQAGETMKVYLPQVECLINPGACPDKDVAAGDCTLAVGFVTVTKKAGSATGDVTKDYTVASGKWTDKFTATKETYVVVQIKWYQHGSEAFLLNDPYAKQIEIVIEDATATAPATPIGTYWQSELNSDVAKIQAVRASTQNSLSEFFFLSDVHWGNNAQVSPALINYLSAQLEETHVLLGGDVVNAYHSASAKAVEEIESFYRALEGYTKTGEDLKIFSTVGGHDRNHSISGASTQSTLDEQTVYELFLERVESFGTTVANNPNQSCFDDTESKVRYIQFYMADGTNSTYTDAALDWAEDRIMELESDWTVVLLSHGYRKYNSGTKQLELPAKNVEYKDRILAIKAAAEAEIACWLVGGAHVDYTEILTCAANDETLRLIAFGSDSFRNSNNEKHHGMKNLAMSEKNATEQSFGFVQIDPILKKITVTRFGSGEDAIYTYGTNTVKISVTNGMLPCGESVGEYPIGDRVTITAKIPPKGYRFTHWEDAQGENVGDTQTLTVTVAQAAQYKAYYEVYFNEDGAPKTIAASTTADWRQGGLSGQWAWTATTDTTRVSFKNAYLLRAGERLTVTVPDVVCCVTPGDCPKLEGVGDCIIRPAIVELSKNEGSATGDITQDYTVVKGYWKDSFTAEKDTYLTVVIKWDKHGDKPFLLDNDYHKQIKVTVTPVTEGGHALGYYWVDELEDAIDKIEANREAHGALSEFIFLTDIHWFGNTSTQYSPALVNYLSKKTDTSFMVFGGDIIHGTPSKNGAIAEITRVYEALEGYTKTGENLRIMSTLGNHDRNYLTDHTDHTLNEQEAYDLYTKRMEGWGVTVEGNSNVSYYDDSQNKVRYIQFFFSSSSIELPEDQYIDSAMAWAEEKIKDLAEDWTVILFTHGFLPSTGGGYSELDKRVANNVLRIKAEADAELACWIVGHNHLDSQVVLEGNDGTRLRVISCAVDGYPKDEHLNSTQEQCFSFMQVDTANKKIYLTRIGRGNDRVIDYSDSIVGTFNPNS
ncbi:MAG: metallophosphoesterase [Clostridia bacterium]|nr:metallophosphoesterase [Clostridia bacterium]